MNKKLCLIGVLFWALIFNSNGQQTDNQVRIAEINTTIDSAVANEDFQKAAELKAEKELRMKLERAINEEEFLRASEIKKQLTASTNGENELQKQLKEAIENEDYLLAEKFQREIDAGVNTERTLPTSSEKNVQYEQPPREDYYYKSRDSEEPLTLEIPKFFYQVYNRQVDGSLNSLEKVTGQLKTGGGGYGGFSGRRTSYVLPGSRSRISIRKNDMSFVVRAEPGVDPANHIQLIQLESKRKHRYAHKSEGRSFVYGSSSNQVTENIMDISFESIGNDVFKIKIHGHLKSGQYAFRNGKRFYAFSLY